MKGRMYQKKAGDPVQDCRLRPEWPLLFARLAVQNAARTWEVALRIDHISSNLSTRIMRQTIIDIQISVASFEPLDAAYPEKLGAYLSCG